MAIARSGGYFDDSIVEGWYEVSPSSWIEPIIHYGDTMWEYYLTFAIQNRQGDFGFVDYQPTSGWGISISNRKYAVSSGPFERKGRDQTLRSAVSGHTVIPFRFKIDVEDYTDDSYDIKVSVSPNLNNKIHTFLKYSEATRRQSRKKLQAEAVARAKAKAKAKREAQVHTLRSERLKFCDIMTDVLKQAVSWRNQGRTMVTTQSDVVKYFLAPMQNSGLTDEVIALFKSWAESILVAVYDRPHLSIKRESELFLSKCKNDNENWTKYKENVSWLDWFR